MENFNEVGQRKAVTPKDFFLQLGSIAALYVSVISLLTLLFQVINKALPDPLNDYGYYYDFYSPAIRMSIASLLVIFPIFLVLSWLLQKEYFKNPFKKELSIRRWLANLTMFVAGAVIAGDLIFLINEFLGGEITLRFILKVLAILIVSALAFGYFLYDLKADMPKRHRMAFLYTSIGLVVLSIVLGFVYLGSPMSQRNMRLDAERENDLSQIQNMIIYQYWQQKGSLPESMNDLKNLLDYTIPRDPETDEAYIYAKTGEFSFNLCANFNQASQNNPQEKDLAYPGSSEKYRNENWNHAAGYYCFERTIDPELYPPVKTQR